MRLSDQDRAGWRNRPCHKARLLIGCSAWKKPKATPKAVVERAAVFGQLDFDNHRIEFDAGADR